jgi:hypothetical protein
LLFRELLPCWPDWTLQCNVAPADLVEDKRINVCRSFGIGVSRMRPGEVLGDHPPAHTKEVDNLPDQTRPDGHQLLLPPERRREGRDIAS